MNKTHASKPPTMSEKTMSAKPKTTTMTAQEFWLQEMSKQLGISEDEIAKQISPTDKLRFKWMESYHAHELALLCGALGITTTPRGVAKPQPPTT